MMMHGLANPKFLKAVNVIKEIITVHSVNNMRHIKNTKWKKYSVFNVKAGGPSV
jgi:hypothetical protein